MSLTVAGITALGYAASRGQESYVRGCDVLGAGVEPSVDGSLIHSEIYRTQVAAGLTVLAVWALCCALVKGSK